MSGFTSTPYNISVGGTDFGDSYAGTESSYWNAGNTANYGSAKSYIPEIPWNDSCADNLILNFLNTYYSFEFDQRLRAERNRYCVTLIRSTRRPCC